MLLSWYMGELVANSSHYYTITIFYMLINLYFDYDIIIITSFGI